MSPEELFQQLVIHAPPVPEDFGRLENNHGYSIETSLQQLVRWRIEYARAMSVAIHKERKG